MMMMKTAIVQVGDEAPDFVAKDLDGNLRSFKNLAAGQKTLLVFYRGGWCPFCNKQLTAIMQDYPKFKELSTTIVAVSCEEVVKGKKLLRKINMPFVLLSDTNFDGIDRYGVRDTNPSDQVKALGITTLARPSAFIIDRNGTVGYKYVGKDAADRPNNGDLLAVLKELE